MDYALGIDIGGTKVASGLVDQNGDCSYRFTLPSITSDSESLFAQVISCIDQVLGKSGMKMNDLVGMGVGTPGMVDSKNGIALFQNNLPWDHFPVIKRLTDHYPGVPILMDNDVYMAAYAEWMSRGGMTNETFVYITVSTGISCCTIHRGNIIRGQNFAGEIGYIPVNEEGKTLEETASGPGIKKLAMKYRVASDESAINPGMIMEKFKEKNSDVIRLMDEVFCALAKAISVIECLLDPNLIVFGGGVINGNPELLSNIKAKLKTYLAPMQVPILNRIEVSQMKGTSGIVGAGLRVHDVHNQQNHQLKENYFL